MAHTSITSWFIAVQGYLASLGGQLPILQFQHVTQIDTRAHAHKTIISLYLL